MFLNEYLREAKRSAIIYFTQERNVMCSQTQLDDIANEQTIICKQLFAGHEVEFSANEKEEKFANVLQTASSSFC